MDTRKRLSAVPHIHLVLHSVAAMEGVALLILMTA